MGEPLVAMKLVLLALVLCGAAFAAPRSNFLEDDQLVPEEELAQVGLSSNVATLKKQFHELQVQLKDNSEVTPGVKATIERMIKMVTGEIQPAITSAHEDEQEDLNLQMKGIGELNKGLARNVDLMRTDANIVRGLIKKQQAAAKAWDYAAGKFTHAQNSYLETYDEERDTCCQKVNSAVIDREYTPAFWNCDYTVPAGADCSVKARQAVAKIVTTPFTDGLKLYRRLLGDCSGLTAELETANSNVDFTIKKCKTKKLAEAAAADEATDEEARVLREWDNMMTLYNGNYTVKKTKYDATEGKVKGHETDRKAEWKATHQIKCMLESYQEEGTFDSPKAAKCNKLKSKGGDLDVQLDIGYPVHIPRSKPKRPVFDKQTVTAKYEDVCDARTPAPEYTCVERRTRPTPECSPYDLEQNTVHA